MECDLTIVHLIFFLVKNAPVNVNGIMLNMEDQLLLIPSLKNKKLLVWHD